MRKGHFGDLTAFLAVAEEGNFTRAAARLGLSLSGLSRAIQGLEERVGVRLLDRTTRSVAITPAGGRLLGLRSTIATLEQELAGLADLDALPSGRVRIAAPRHAAQSLLWPALRRLLHKYPALEVEIATDQSPDARAFDAWISQGEQVERNLTAIRIGPDLRMAVVGSPSYLSSKGRLETPGDLALHECIECRSDPHAWSFARDGASRSVRPGRRLVLDDSDLAVQAALDGIGLACVFEDEVAPLIATGRLVRVLRDWCPSLPGYHLHYAEHEVMQPALTAIVAALRQQHAPLRPHLVHAS